MWRSIWAETPTERVSAGAPADAAVLQVLRNVPVRHGLQHAEPEAVDHAALRHRADGADVDRVQLQGLRRRHA